MKKVLTAVIAVVAIAIAFVVFPIITEATTNLLTDEYTQTVDTVTATNGKATVTLTHNVFDDKASAILKVTSTNASDTVIVDSVSENEVVFSGLDNNNSRSLTIKYQSPALTDYIGLEAIIKITPMLVYVVMILGLVVGVFKTGNNA